MLHAPKPKSPGRVQRHSAAWGKRVATLLLVLIAEAAFAQNWVGKFAPDLAPTAERAHHGAASTETVRVIVQYKNIPQPRHERRVMNLGAHLNHRLGTV